LTYTYEVGGGDDDDDDDDDDDKEAEEIPLIPLIGIIGGSIAAAGIAIIIAWKKQLFSKGRNQEL